MSEKKPRKKTGGRKPGSLNRKTIIGKNVQETLRAWLGFDDESVARTGMIDRDGYRGRLALREMWDDKRPISTLDITKVVEPLEENLRVGLAHIRRDEIEEPDPVYLLSWLRLRLSGERLVGPQEPLSGRVV